MVAAAVIGHAPVRLAHAAGWSPAHPQQRVCLRALGHLHGFELANSAHRRHSPHATPGATRHTPATGVRHAALRPSRWGWALWLPGPQVICADNFFTGSKENIAHLLGKPNFELIRHDVVEPILLEVDQIYHLACPASPVHYK